MRPVAASLCIGGAAFFLLAGYEFARSASSSLFIGKYGAGSLPFVMALSPVGTLAFLYSYGILLSWLKPRATLAITTLLSGGGLLACYLLIVENIGWGTALLFILREAYIVVLIEQYWSFIDSTLSEKQAQRYNGPICGFASIGAIAGSTFVGFFAKHFGTEVFIVMAAGMALPAAGFGVLAYRLGGEPSDDHQIPKTNQLGWSLFSRYQALSVMFFIIVATQVISTTLDVRFSLLLEQTKALTDERTSYLGFFWTSVNTASFVLQFAIAPIVLAKLRPTIILAIIPAVHIVTSGILLIHPSLFIASIAFLVFKSIDYSIFRAAKELLYLPLPFAARYRSKQLIDAFGYRTSKGITSIVIATAREGLHSPSYLYPILAIAASLLWLVMVIGRLFRSPANRKDHVS